MQAERQLPKLVRTLGLGRRRPDLLDGRQQQADQNTQDTNHDERLDERNR